MYSLEKLKAELIRDEGKRLTSYQDTKNNWTIGVGHLLGPTRSMTTITDEQCNALLIADLANASNEATHWFFNWNTYLDDVRQRAYLNMCFNLGNRIGNFHHFLTHLKNGEWKSCVDELKNTPWAAEVGVRAQRIQSMLLEGNKYDQS